MKEDKKMKKTILWLIIIIFILSLTLIGTGCKEEAAPAEEVKEEVKEEEAEPAEEEVEEVLEKPSGEITVWHGDSDEVAKITQELIETSFNVEYPDIKVNYELAPDPFQDKLLITVPSGTGPDLFEWNHDWIGTAAKAGIISPIDELITTELLEKFYSSAVKAGSYKGNQYTLPISAEAVAMAYNKSLMGDRPIPTTSDELVELMEEFKDEDLYFSFPMAPFTVSGFVHAFGGYFWDDDLGLGVNSEGTIEAMEWILETFKPYMTEDATWDPQVALFPEAKAPLAINGPWALGDWTNAGIDYGLTLLPKISEIDKDPMPYTGVKSIYMTSSCENREAAFAFMVWATTNKDRILNRAIQLGYIPVLKEILEVQEVKDDPKLSVFSQEVALGKPMASGPEMVAVWGPMQSALDAMWSGVKTVEEALNEAQAEIQKSIDEME